MTRRGAYSGLRVLDLSRLLPGAYCTLLLADLGADVLKIEQPETGDYMRWMQPYSAEYSALFSATCRNKRSVTLDLKSAPGQDVLHRLVETADVVVESFRPGVSERLRADHATLAAINDRLIYCSLSGYGQDGPYAQRAGHDLNYLALAGMLDLNGPADGPPVPPGVQMADVWGGGVSAALAIATALYERERTGHGRFLDAAMFDGSTAGLVNHAPAWFVGEETLRRGETSLTGRHPNYHVYPAKDGYLSVANYEDKFWVAFCNAIERPDLSGCATVTGAERDRVVDEISAITRQRTRAEWSEVLADVDTCVEPVLHPEEALESEHFQVRGLVVDIGSDDVRERQLATPLTRYGSGPHAAAPRLGQHTDVVLRDLGLSDEEIDRLREQEAIG